jgi:hypothetical protein
MHVLLAAFEQLGPALWNAPFTDLVSRAGYTAPLVVGAGVLRASSSTSVGDIAQRCRGRQRASLS